MQPNKMNYETSLTLTNVAQLSAVITGGGYKRSATKPIAIARFVDLFLMKWPQFGPKELNAILGQSTLEDAKAKMDEITDNNTLRGQVVEKEAGHRMVKKDLDKEILVLVEKNDRREGTFGYKSLQIILDAKAAGEKLTYGQFIERGGRRKDFLWDKKYGRVDLAE